MSTRSLIVLFAFGFVCAVTALVLTIARPATAGQTAWDRGRDTVADATARAATAIDAVPAVTG